MTTGAFYDHFGSKDNAFQAALEAGLDETHALIARFREAHGDAWLGRLAEYYLGGAHRAADERLCAMTALAPDAARGTPAHRAAFEASMAGIAAAIAEGLESGNAAERAERAWSILACLVGGLTLARAMASEDVADAVADAVAWTVHDL